ncbi:MAG: YdcF family protein, partial [Pseudomonadota bacterium]
ARNGFGSILVVTSARHMPRGLSELARASPATNFHAAPVHPTGRPDGPWWTNLGQVRLLLQEYAKFLPSAGRYLAARARAAFDGRETAAPRSPAGPSPAVRNTLTSS